MNGWGRVLAGIALAGLGYAVSARAGAWLADPWIACAAGRFHLTCAMPEDGALSLDAYLAIALSAAGLWVGSAVFFRRRIAYPFIALFSGLALAAMAYDMAFHNGLVAGAKLANDTFNVLRFVIFASFVLTFVLAKGVKLGLGAIAVAVTASYAGALAFMFGFIAVRDHLMGALELLVLYGAYAFGGFTVHLMTVSLLIATARLPKQAGAASAA